MEIVALVFFGAWLALSAAWQFSGVRDALDRVPVLREYRLLPIYTFFAPNPGISDYHLLVRSERDDGTVTPWQELAINRPRTPFDLFWHPTKRRQKLVADALSGIKQVRNDALDAGEDDEAVSTRVKLSHAYVVLLNYAMSDRTLPAGTPRQFVIAESMWASGRRELVPLFRSPFHASA